VRNRPTILALPDNVRWEDMDFEPTWEERALDWHRQQAALALAEVQRMELEEHRLWLVAATQRAVAAGLLIDEDERKIALREEMDRTNKWWADTAEREKAQTEALMAQYQKILDKGVFEKMKARAAKAGEDIKRDNARIERLELMRRGIVRGLRKK
jgi:hypothetical protein